MYRGGYDTDINVIGGLRDCEMILRLMEAHFKTSESLRILVREDNALALRTERSRVRIERAIRNGFFHFVNSDHEDLIRGIFGKRTPQVPLKDKVLILMWQLALNNRLFREVTLAAFVKIYFSGRASISKEDIIGCLKEMLSQNGSGSGGGDDEETESRGRAREDTAEDSCADKTEDSKRVKWSESTIHTLATKYLNFMGKLDFLKGLRVKSFKAIRPSSEALILFLYFAALHDPDRQNILKNDFLPLSFLSTETLREQLKKLSLKGYFDMSYDGVALNVDLIHSHKEICDVLYA